jgi:hypothetical protein
MPSQTYDRAQNTKNQKVYKPKVDVPSSYAPNQGAGRPGRPSANQIRTTIRARLYGTSVAPSHGSKNPKPHRAKGFPPGVTPQPPAAKEVLDRDSTGSAAGPSGAAYSSRPRQRRIVRSQIAG